MGVGGVFRKTIEIPKAGWNDILVVATDPSGNRVERRQRVFVEVY
jgi:imidazoleglycerol phosphate synthase glutamine amidotransferase subunit HisH